MDKSTPPQKMKKMKLPSRRRGRKKKKKSERKAFGLVTCKTPVPNPNYAWCKG